MYRGTQIDELQRQLKVVEQRLRNLEVRQHPALAPKVDFVPVNITCVKCGVVWTGPTGYSCPNMDCPIGAGPIMCKS